MTRRLDGQYLTVTPASRESWREIFNRDVSATAFQSPDWMLAASADGHYVDASRLYSTPDGKVLLPLAEANRLGCKVSAASMPHGLGAAGLISDMPLTTSLVRSIIEDLMRLPHFRVAVRPNALQAPVWEAAIPPTWEKVKRRTHIIDLREGYEGWRADRLTRPKKGKIRKAIREGVLVEHGNSEEFVRRYYDLYMRWTENRAVKRRLPAMLLKWLAARREPLWKFRETAQKLGNDLRIYIASYQGQDAAGAVFLGAGRGAVYWRSASDTRITQPCNDLLQNEMIKYACMLGCTHYHMGESGGVASLEEFKESFGAVAHDYAEYVYGRVQRPWSRADVLQ
ncbi:GNAT family N-acetyltransferase [Rhizobium herbae]